MPSIAVANLEPGGLRLDVHVAGPRLDRFEQNLVHQPDDRGLLGLGQLGGVDLVEQLDVFLVLLGEQAFDRLAAHAEVGLDLLGDFCRGASTGSTVSPVSALSSSSG